MIKVELIATIRNENTSSIGRVYVKELITPQAPGFGDSIIAFKYLDATDFHGTFDDGSMWTVKDRYWDSDGGIHIILEEVIIDPDRNTQNLIHRSQESETFTITGWNSIDGDLDYKLRNAGWKDVT